AALVIMLLNIYLFPNLMQPRVQEVSYSAFLEMLERGEVGEVSQDEVQITFSDRAAEPNYYKTGVMDDPELIARLTQAGVAFTKPIVEPASPLISFLLSWI